MWTLYGDLKLINGIQIQIIHLDTNLWSVVQLKVLERGQEKRSITRKKKARKLQVVIFFSEKKRQKSWVLTATGFPVPENESPKPSKDKISNKSNIWRKNGKRKKQRYDKRPEMKRRIRIRLRSDLIVWMQR